MTCLLLDLLIVVDTPNSNGINSYLLSASFELFHLDILFVADRIKSLLPSTV